MKISKGSNLLKLHHSGEISVDLELKQINFLSDRVYKRSEDVYYPSVTSILQYFPKGKFFEDWLKEAGPSADLIKEKAAKEGSETHNMIERLLKGEELNWIDDFGNATCSEQVWQMTIKFADFWNQVKPELIATEKLLFSDNFQYAGTTDLICKIQDEVWMIDVKTSNALYKSYDLQLASYARAWEEMGNVKIDKAGILWLKSAKRGEGKKDKIQGKGWELKLVEDVEGDFELFQNIYKLYKLEHSKVEPIYNQYPITLKL